MQDVLTALTQLRRPRLLIRAAKEGAEDYVRDQHLKRLMGKGAQPHNGTVLKRLMEMEQDVNKDRRAGAASYSIITHVDLMIAMVGEARLLRASQS